MLAQAHVDKIILHINLLFTTSIHSNKKRFRSILFILYEYLASSFLPSHSFIPTQKCQEENG